MAINIKTYKENKDIIRNLKKINQYFVDQFPEKSAGWVGVTALLYSQCAIEAYLEQETDKDKRFIPALKAILWSYLNEISRYNGGKGKE